MNINSPETNLDIAFLYRTSWDKETLYNPLEAIHRCGEYLFCLLRLVYYRSLYCG